MVFMNQHNLLIMAILASVALLGGILSALWTPSHTTRSLIQHFAAGVVLAALAVELLPEIEREHAPGLVLIGSFALGSLFMYVCIKAMDDQTRAVSGSYIFS
jgi:ZIP family zinc transporter